MNLIKKLYWEISFLKNNRSKHCKKRITSSVSPETVCGGFNLFEKRSSFEGRIGRYSYIGGGSHVLGEVGAFCSIGQNVNVIYGAHPLNRVSTHPLFSGTYSFKKANIIEKQENSDFTKRVANGSIVTIGNDVWIGANVTILAGITIGDGAVIGAGSVVTKDVAPYAIVGGNPAKLIRFRFDEATINGLLKSDWWNKPIEWIKDNVSLFMNPKEIIGK